MLKFNINVMTIVIIVQNIVYPKHRYTNTYTMSQKNLSKPNHKKFTTIPGYKQRLF